MSTKVEDFLTPEQEQEIVNAIQTAEKNTSGEVRVHIEEGGSTDAYQRSMEVFAKLGMEKTRQRNGILFYFAVQTKQFAVFGDQGIHDKVTQHFWDSIRDEMLVHFRKNSFKEGIVAGILKVGEELKKYFPYDTATDINELPDELSKGTI